MSAHLSRRRFLLSVAVLITASAVMSPTAQAGTTGAAADQARALLPASQVPQFNENIVPWRVTGTVLDQPKRVMRPWQTHSLGALGATHVAHRAYVWASPQAADDYLSKGHATDTAAMFPSAAAASRATSSMVLDLRTSNGYLFLLTHAVNADEATFEYVGVARHGASVALITWELVGQDLNYDIEHLPPATMLGRAIRLTS